MGDHVTIGGVRFDTVSPERAVNRTVSFAERRLPYTVVTPNATMLHRALHDRAFFSLIQKASLVLPDGVGVILAARYLKTPFDSGKIAGVRFGEALLEKMADRGLKVAFFGGKAGVAERAKERLTARHPKLSVAYCRDGYHFSSDSVAEEILKSSAELVFVCLGSPLQERVGLWLAERLSCPTVCLGGSLDVYAGDVKRAPKLFRALGLEWLWRMLSEPRRFRGLVTLFSFFCDVLRLKKAKRSCNRGKRGV